MTGTEKQIRWAEEIKRDSTSIWSRAAQWLRAHYPNDLDEIQSVLNTAATCDDASVWINSREWRYCDSAIADPYAILWALRDPRWREHKAPRFEGRTRLRSLRDQAREAILAVTK